MRTLASVIGLLALAACGPGEGPALSRIRCAEAGCQSAENPLEVRVEVDFEDADGDLSSGRWWSLQDRHTVAEGALSETFAAQGIVAGTPTGVLGFSVPLSFEDLQDGLEVEVSLLVEDGAGHRSNQPGLLFVLHRN